MTFGSYGADEKYLLELLISLLSATSWGGDVQRKVCLLLVTDVRMHRNGKELCPGRSRLDIGKHLVTLGGWSDSGTGFLVRWLVPYASQCSRGTWTMLSATCFLTFGWPWEVRQLDWLIAPIPGAVQGWVG